MKKKTILLLVVGVLLVGAIGTGISYALWSKTFSQTGKNTVVSDCFQMSFTEDTSSFITLSNAFPIRDNEGVSLKPYKFSVENKCGLDVTYQIHLETTNNTTMKDNYLKIKLNENNPTLLTNYKTGIKTISNVKSSYELESGIITGNQTSNYSVRIWMDENVTQKDVGAMNSLFESKITVTGSYIKKYQESILNGTDPVLKDNLIPVTILDDGTVKKADIQKEWYNYTNKVWANAVILFDENKTYYSDEVIPENDIESYFVWIPRYKYQIFNDGNYPGLTTVENKEQEIKVIFENKTASVSNGSTVNSWLTHPVFTSFDSNGMWVGKYETGYKGATSTANAQINSSDSSRLQIKPNVYSWRGIQVSNAHLSSYNYQRDLDSHMMKNTEWGAVAYLQHSKYGSMTSVRVNNNSSYITGYAAMQEPTCGYTETNKDCNKYEGTSLNADGTYTKRYNSAIGYNASTTNNISGIYDMSGGSWEYVMGVMLDTNKKPMSGRNNLYNSGFNGTYGCPTCDSDTSGKTELTTGINFPEEKYYDKYSYAENDETYQRRILGDATGEMGPFQMKQYGTQNRPISSWYADESWFVLNSNPWFGRGFSFLVGTGAGINAFYNTLGRADDNDGFRVVLSI